MPSLKGVKPAQQESNRWKLWTSIIVPLLVVLLPLLWPDVRVWLHLSKKASDTTTRSNNSNAQGNGNVANSGGTDNATGTVAGNGNIIGNNNTVNLLPEAKKKTATTTEAPVAKREHATKKKAEDQPSPVQINAPNGIAIGGRSTVNNPTVNNIVPRARVTASPQRQKQVGENWITEFVISSTDIIPTGIIRLTYDGVILGGGVSSNAAIMGTRHVGVDPSDPTTLVIDLTAPESISPNHPIAISVSAKTPVQIISGTIGGAKIEVPITNPGSAQQPTFSVTNPTGSIINQGSRVDAPQTVNNFAPAQRRLGQDQRTTLVDCLKRGSGSAVFLWFAQHNIEVQTYSDDFSSALKDAGWEVKAYPVFLTETRQGTGVQVWVSDPNNPPYSAKVLFGCLDYLKLKPAGIPNKDLLGKDEVLLYVGAPAPAP